MDQPKKEKSSNIAELVIDSANALMTGALLLVSGGALAAHLYRLYPNFEPAQINEAKFPLIFYSILTPIALYAMNRFANDARKDLSELRTKNQFSRMTSTSADTQPYNGEVKKA